MKYTWTMKQKIVSCYCQAMTTVLCSFLRAIALDSSPLLHGGDISAHWVANLTIQPYSTSWWSIFRTPLPLGYTSSFSRWYVNLSGSNSNANYFFQKDRDYPPCYPTPRRRPVLLWPSGGQSFFSRRACSTDSLPFSTPRTSYPLSSSPYIYPLSGTNYSWTGNGATAIDKKWYGVWKIIL